MSLMSGCTRGGKRERERKRDVNGFIERGEEKEADWASSRQEGK